jgi:hypothetical protein
LCLRETGLARLVDVGSPLGGGERIGAIVAVAETDIPILAAHTYPHDTQLCTMALR